MGGAATVGRLVVTVSGDVDQLKIDMREAQAITGSATKEIVNGLQGITDATSSRNDAGKRMIAAMREEIATFGMSADEMKIYKASLLGVGDEARRLVDQTNAMKSAQAAFTQEAAATSNAFKSHSAAANDAGESVEKFGFHTAAAKRELLVLAHELSQGNYKKFGGSMLVIGEQTGAAGLLFSAAGLAAIGMGAALVGVTAAIVKGTLEQKAMNDALIVTGGYAGVTGDALNGLAHQAVASGGSIGEAKKAVIELAGTGKYTGEQIGLITAAAVSMEAATGRSAEETIKQFETLAVEMTGSSARATEAISKATIKLNDEYHFLTIGVYEQIHALEKEGDAKAASAVATEAFAKATKDRAEEIVSNLGYVARAWHGVKEAIGGAVDSIGDWGKKATAASTVASLEAQLGARNARTGQYIVQDDPSTGRGGVQLGMDRTKMLADLAAAQRALNIENQAALDKGAAQAKQNEAIHAASMIHSEDIRLEKKGMTELQVSLREYQENLAKIRATNPTDEKTLALISPEAEAAGIAARTRAHTEQLKGNDDRAKVLQDALLIEQTGLDREKSVYDARDKMLALYHSKFGTSDDDFYAGRATARAEYVAAEAISFAKEAALINGFKPKNKEEVAAQKEKYDALLKQHLEFVDKMNASASEDKVNALGDMEKQYKDIVKAIQTDGVAEDKRLDEAISKQKLHNAEIGRSKEQIELAKQASEDLGTVQLQSDADFIRNAIAKEGFDDKAMAAYQIRLAFLDTEIAKRRELSGLLASGAVLEADAKAAAEATKAWKHAATTIETDLTNAILDGGGKGWKKLVHDMEFAFARMVLSPILQPISGGIASYLNPLAAQAQAGGTASAASGYIGAAQSAKAAYDAINGGFASISTPVADGVQSIMSAAGYYPSAASGVASGSGQALTPFAQGAGTAASYAAGAAAGKFAGSAISGQYSVGDHGSAIVNIGTAIGAIWGPLGAALGGAIGGLVNRAFGMGSEEVQGRTLNGTLGSSGFTGGTDFNIHQDGGWFRSDKDFIRTTAADDATAKALASAYDQIKVASADFAKTLGINADSIKDRTQALSVALTTDQTANGKAVADFFVGVGDMIAKELLPSVTDFAKAGESASTTLQRLAGDFQVTDQLAQQMGKTVTEVFGAAGIESAAARERLIDLSGGTAALLSKQATYAQSFLTDAEKIAPVLKTVAGAMDSLGLASVTTKVQFKDEVDKLAKSGALATDAGAKLYANLMDLAPAFAQAADYTAALQKATEDKAAADAAAAQKLADDAIQAAQESARNYEQNVAAARANLSSAYDTEASALQGAIKAQQDFAKSIRAYKDSLLLGSNSPLSPEARYAEARRQLQSATPENFIAASNAFLDASKAYNGSTDSFARDFNMVQELAKQTASAADASAAFAAQQLTALNDSVKGLIDINKSVLSVRDAIVALKATTAAGGIPSTGVFSTAPGGAFGITYTDQQLIDAAAGKIWSERDSGQAYMQHHPASNNFEYMADGSHANGLDRVPFNGYKAITHVDEAILSAPDARRWRAGQGGDDSAAKETNALLRNIITHLGAVVAQGGAVGTETIARLEKLADKADATKRELARA